ncbi:MAG: hypothetical protein JXK94_13205 [Deltaproteobacteria bacterium]|nr:hypothetical protein [Deltaproteobacteria bacterium]
MAKHKGRTDRELSRQADLFATPPDMEEGALDIVLGLKQLLSKLLRGHDRYLVAAQISKATLKEISKDSLDKLLSSDPAYQPSAVQVTAICKITRSYEPFQYLLEPLNAGVLLPEDKDLIELARLTEERRRIEARVQEIQAKRGLAHKRGENS